MTKIYNQSREREKRRALRKRMPVAQRKIWGRLRGRQFLGYKFRREYSVGKFSIDLYCPALKLAIEVDGTSHRGEPAQARDRERELFIGQFGIRFVHVKNQDVYENLDGVMEGIAEALKNLDAAQVKSSP